MALHRVNRSKNVDKMSRMRERAQLLKTLVLKTRGHSVTPSQLRSAVEASSDRPSADAGGSEALRATPRQPAQDTTASQDIFMALDLFVIALLLLLLYFARPQIDLLTTVEWAAGLGVLIAALYGENGRYILPVGVLWAGCGLFGVFDAIDHDQFGWLEAPATASTLLLLGWKAFRVSRWIIHRVRDDTKLKQRDRGEAKRVVRAGRFHCLEWSPHSPAMLHGHPFPRSIMNASDSTEELLHQSLRDQLFVQRELWKHLIFTAYHLDAPRVQLGCELAPADVRRGRSRRFADARGLAVQRRCLPGLVQCLLTVP